MPPDIRDIRGPIHIPYWWIPLAIAAAATAAVAASFLIYRFVRRRRAERSKTPAEIALARIESARENQATVSSAELSSEISDAVRAYIEATFSLRVTRRTTEEFLHEVLGAGTSPVAGHRDALDDFLSWCDLAKFARLTLSAEHVDALVHSARHFIDATSTPLDKPLRRPRKVRIHEPLAEVGT